MATFISVPLKKSSEVDLVKPLSKFVTATYQTNEEQGEYIRAVEELNKLRRNALIPAQKDVGLSYPCGYLQVKSLFI